MKKAFHGLFSIKSLQNRNLSLAILTALFFLSLGAGAQTPYDSTRTKTSLSGRIEYGVFGVKNAFTIPLTKPQLAVKDSGAIAYSSGKIYTWNGYNWVAPSGGGSGYDSTRYNFDSTRYINYAGGIGVDSFPVALAYLKAGDNTVFSYDGDTTVINSTGGVDSNAIYRIDTAVDNSYVDYISLKTIWRVSLIGGGGSGGSGITYPNTTAKYLNGYGNFPALNTDSIGPGSVNKFSQWVNVTGGLNYANNVGFNKSLPTEKIDVVGNINVSQDSAYKYNGVNVITANPSSFNYFFGNSGNSTMTGVYNMALGYISLNSNTTGASNVALGGESMYSNTTGSANVGAGTSSLRYNTTGEGNSAFGAFSLFRNTIGKENAALGKEALYNNLSGYYNTSSGFQSLKSNTTGYNNNSFGAASLSFNTIGHNNVAIGSKALWQAVNSSYNIAIGDSSLVNITSSATTYNTVIGIASGNGITSGSGNTILGSNISIGNVSNNIAIASGDGVVKIRTTSDGVTSLYHGTNVASASTITATGNSFHVTGTTGITSISGSVLTAGATITLIFDGALTVTDGSNLILAGNLTTTTGTTLTLKFDGTNFYELSRSIN